MSALYRGYEIMQRSTHKWDVLKDGARVHTARSEDAAFLWIDGEKAVEHKKG